MSEEIKPVRYGEFLQEWWKSSTALKTPEQKSKESIDKLMGMSIMDILNSPLGELLETAVPLMSALSDHPELGGLMGDLGKKFSQTPEPANRTEPTPQDMPFDLSEGQMPTDVTGKIIQELIARSEIPARQTQ